MGSGKAASSNIATVNKSSVDLSMLKNAGYKAASAVTDVGVRTYGAGTKVVTTVKDRGPDSVKNAFCGTLSLGSKAVALVKENGPQMLKNYTPGPERIQQISPYVNHPATREFMKCFLPGVSPYISLAGAALKGTSIGVQAGYEDKKSENERLKAENERLKAEYERLKKLEYLGTTQTRRSKL